MYHFRCEQIIEKPIEEVFEFFGEAENLERITPPWLKFKIVTPRPIEMKPGTIIDYRLKIHGIPVRWQSEITAWEPPRRFIDEQRRGPYRKWIHEHLFEPIGEQETRMTDDVRYSVLGGWPVHRFFVKRDVEKIFEYRRTALEGLLPAPPDRSTPLSWQ